MYSIIVVGHVIIYPIDFLHDICPALQQNRQQVTSRTGLFGIWKIEVDMIGVKNNSSVNFEIFVFSHTLICFILPPCNS